MNQSTTDFSVRDLNRQFAKVPEACDRLGLIRSRKGTTYELRPEPPPTTAPKAEYPDFAARRRALKMPMMTKTQSEQLDKLIAGE
jgi:hypothetical protein